jgi:hypothetical protein
MTWIQPVRKKVMNINGSANAEDSAGKAHKTASHNFASPPPIQLFAHARSKARLAIHNSILLGTCTMSPTIKIGRLYQFGTRRLRKSYKLMANAYMSNQAIGCS